MASCGGDRGAEREVQPAGERSELFAAALVIAYLAFSLPAVAAGFATTSVGLQATMLVYGLGVVALGLVALAAQGMRSARLKSNKY